MAEQLHGVALVTGGGRGIGASVARELAAAGMRVAVTGRTAEQVEAVAGEIGGLALVGDVSDQATVESWVASTEAELGPVDLLVANAGVIGSGGSTWEIEPGDWWRAFEVNVLGVFLSCRAVLPSMIARRAGRIVTIGSGASYLPAVPHNVRDTSYGSSKAALGRFTEQLAAEVQPHSVHVFLVAPGMVRTDMTVGWIPDDAPWTPPELAPRLVRILASGRADALAGRYLHAEHDNIEALILRADEVVAGDLNAIRLRR